MCDCVILLRVTTFLFPTFLWRHLPSLYRRCECWVVGSERKAGDWRAESGVEEGSRAEPAEMVSGGKRSETVSAGAQEGSMFVPLFLFILHLLPTALVASISPHWLMAPKSPALACTCPIGDLLPRRITGAWDVVNAKSALLSSTKSPPPRCYPVYRHLSVS